MSRFPISKRTPLWLVVVVVVLVSVGQRYRWWQPTLQPVLKPVLQPIKKAAIQNQPGLYKVIADVDGDTIIVDMNGTQEKIRLIGVDTPETHDPRKSVQCFGQVAAAYTKKSIVGTAVRLEADSKGTNRDRYNRLLRYVYLQDGTLLNQKLIEQGYGFAYTGFPFTKKEQFVASEVAAQNSKLGLWGSCQPTKNQYGGYTSNNATP